MDYRPVCDGKVSIYWTVVRLSSLVSLVPSGFRLIGISISYSPVHFEEKKKMMMTGRMESKRSPPQKIGIVSFENPFNSSHPYA